MKWRASSERHAARMRLRNLSVRSVPELPEARRFFWERVRVDLKTAGWKRGPRERLENVERQLEITGPMIEVKATKRG